MDFSPPRTSSFTPLATIHLPNQHVLHPGACNPVMDLVVLLSSSRGKGKGKEREQAVVGVHGRVELWRMSGTKVWDVDTGGGILGLAWTEDGLHLSLLVIKPSGGVLEHRSVHTGELVRSTPIHMSDLNLEGVGAAHDGDGWWEMSWTADQRDWPEVKPGSSIGIIDSLPRVTPVEPPQPANLRPFAFQSPSAPKIKNNTPHAKLSTFPSLLPSSIPLPPNTLHVTSPNRQTQTSRSLLTGTFPLSSASSEALQLARVTDRLHGFLNVILNGIESMEHVFREAEKQTMIWREELETCADQQGVTHAEVHADLFNLLITGRCGVAVFEWLGNRLTGRTITKWETTLETCFKTIRKVISESITPALERMILLLEEMRGWSRSKAYSHLTLEEHAVQRGLDLLCGFAVLIETMRQDAEQELFAAGEWIKWLKYEIARAAAQDSSSETLPTSLHDIKLVWYFLINGFTNSPFLAHFPQLLIRPPTDLLPIAFDPYPSDKTQSLDSILASALQGPVRRLHDKNVKGSVNNNVAAGSPDTQQGDESFNSSIPISSDIGTPSRGSSPEIGSSPDTVDIKKSHEAEDEKPVKRILDREPWVWANTLVKHLEDLTQGGHSGRNEGSASATSGFLPPGVLQTDYTRDGAKWVAFVTEENEALVIATFSNGTAVTFGCYSLGDVKIRAMSFFDDLELALILDTSAERYFATVEYATVLKTGATQSLASSSLLEQANQLTAEPLILARCRTLTRPTNALERVSIALNGRKGRRVGCIASEGGREVEVLDMEDDEGDEEEEEEEEMSGMVEEQKED